MRHCSQHWLDRRCREAGKQNGECDGCIVERGEVLTVDENHSAYPPHAPRGPTAAAPVADRSVPLLVRAKNFAAAAARHIAAGAPRAGEDEISRRYAICQSCEHFDGRACMQCGCPIVRESRFISKLSWADQSCPVGKW